MLLRFPTETVTILCKELVSCTTLHRAKLRASLYFFECTQVGAVVVVNFWVRLDDTLDRFPVDRDQPQRVAFIAASALRSRILGRGRFRFAYGDTAATGVGLHLTGVSL